MNQRSDVLTTEDHTDLDARVRRGQQTSKVAEDYIEDKGRICPSCG